MFKYVVIEKKSPIQFIEFELRAVLEHHAKSSWRFLRQQDSQ